MKLLDELQKRFEIPNDRQLASKLGLSTPVISRIRTGKSGVSGDVIIRIHEIFEIPVKEIKELCA